VVNLKTPIGHSREGHDQKLEARGPKGLQDSSGIVNRGSLLLYNCPSPFTGYFFMF
jgi:hypothetical protein